MLFSKRRPLWVAEPSNLRWQMERVRAAEELYPRVLDALYRIMAKNSSMSDSAIARELGLEHARDVCRFWSTHPQLGSIIKQYRKITNHRYPLYIRLRMRRNKHNRAVKREEIRLQLSLERRSARARPPSSRTLHLLQAEDRP